MTSAFQQAQAEGLCLRYPENLGLHRDVTYDSAVNMLLRAMSMAQAVPFAWGFLDKPPGWLTRTYPCEEIEYLALLQKVKFFSCSYCLNPRFRSTEFDSKIRKLNIQFPLEMPV